MKRSLKPGDWVRFRSRKSVGFHSHKLRSLGDAVAEAACGAAWIIADLVRVDGRCADKCPECKRGV